MRRRLFTFCSAGSLLLCVAACGLWVRSYWRPEQVYLLAGHDAWAAGSCRGVLLTTWTTAGSPASAGRRWEYVGTGNLPSYSSMFDLRLGFGMFTLSDGSRVLFFPHAAVAAVGGVMLAALWGCRRRLDRRARAGLCPQCAYDLRATPERCPECGAACKAADPAGPAAGN